MENGPVEIVDFPIKNGDFPWQNVSSPEGIGGYIIPHDGSMVLVYMLT